MELYSMAFFLFVAVSILLHEIVGKVKAEYQWLVKLAASMGFYVFITKLQFIFLFISILVVWASGNYLDNIIKDGKSKRKNKELSREQKNLLRKLETTRKRLVLFTCLSINIGILIAVKMILPFRIDNLVLPLGISFYTFMAISYLVDVYGGKYEAERNLGKIALYLSWFPQIIQGPINRFDFVSNTLYGSYRLKFADFKASCLLFIFGAMKKYALANVLAPSVNEVFLRDNVSDLPGSFLLFTAFLFAIQQYADFSGGINMVMAVSGMFGVKMNENFRQPYFSKSVGEFWRRWHISLGSFLRDYVFYPFALLPGMLKLNDKISSRFGKHAGRSIIAGMGNLLVFLIVGIWHGSALHYIAWGLYNGIIIVISDSMSPVFDKIKGGLGIKKDNKIYAGFQMIRTFFIIVLAGYFDAISNVSNGLICFKNTFTKFKASELKPYLIYLHDCGLITDLGLIVAILAGLIVLTVSILRENHKDVIALIEKRCIVIRWAVYLALIYVMLFGFATAGGNGGFMYAAF